MAKPDIACRPTPAIARARIINMEGAHTPRGRGYALDPRPGPSGMSSGYAALVSDQRGGAADVGAAVTKRIIRPSAAQDPGAGPDPFRGGTVTKREFAASGGSAVPLRDPFHNAVAAFARMRVAGVRPHSCECGYTADTTGSPKGPHPSPALFLRGFLQHLSENKRGR